MAVTIWRFLALVLAALSMTMESAHVLELPQKMQYDAQMYSAVNTTLYRYFAIVGGVYQIGGIAAAGVLALLVRSRWTISAFLLLAAAFFAVWLTLVNPVNGQITEAIRTNPAGVPALWMQLRDRWEYGHALGFVLQFAGFIALVVSVLRATKAP